MTVTTYQSRTGIPADSLNLADYTALRAYGGPGTSAYVTGYLVTAAPSGIAGEFTRDDSDTTSADNGGTIIVATNGKRWKRIFSGNIKAAWFGFSESATAAANNTALQAAIDVAKVIGDTVLADKYVITTSDVDIDAGLFSVSGAVEVYTGVGVNGAGQSHTLLDHAGGASDFFVYTAAGSEYLYNVWVRDLAIRGGGKTTADTLSAVRADRSSGGLAVYGCGVTRCLITNCYDAIGLENAWTFEVSDNEFYDLGRNFVRGENVTAAKIKGNRMDVAGEDGLYLTFSSGASLETIALMLSQNAIQNCQRRGVFGFDCDHLIWDTNYVENCNLAGGYPHVEFDSDSGTNAEMYSFVGGWASPSSNSGQPAFKIDKARMVSSHGVYIRGANFSVGWELGADVEGYAIDGEFNGGTFVSVSGDTTGIAVSRLSMSLHGIDSETQTASQTGSNVNSSTSTRIQEINCTAGNRTYTLLDTHLQHGRCFTVQKVDGGSNQLIVAPTGTTKINGVNASVNSTAAYARAEILCGYEAGTTTPCWYVKFI
jgi:hypothetical protein